jgi:ketosteroid isomerase-like protein
VSNLIQIVRPLVEAWEEGDFRPQPGVTTDDIVLTGLTADGHERVQGADEIGAYMRGIFNQFEDYRIDVASIAEIGDSHVLLEGHQYATGRSSGIPTVDTLFIVFAIRDGQVSAMHWHARRSDALAAAGVALPPA